MYYMLETLYVDVGVDGVVVFVDDMMMKMMMMVVMMIMMMTRTKCKCLHWVPSKHIGWQPYMCSGISAAHSVGPCEQPGPYQ